MYRFVIQGTKDPNEFEELIKVFLRPEEYEVCMPGENDKEDAVFSVGEDKNQTKRQIYDYLKEETGKAPEWGIITGIRPVKLFGSLVESEGGTAGALKRFKEYYLISDEKAELTAKIYEYQQELFGREPEDSAGIYIGIPFCPTRCLYCSFASNPEDDEAIKKYLQALHKEIEAAGILMNRAGLMAESLYIGGGTPTTLSPDQLRELLVAATSAFAGKGLKEFTVEAGRPDTVTLPKMEVLRQAGVSRIDRKSVV